jgi:hypothetical protein
MWISSFLSLSSDLPFDLEMKGVLWGGISIFGDILQGKANMERLNTWISRQMGNDGLICPNPEGLQQSTYIAAAVFFHGSS